MPDDRVANDAEGKELAGCAKASVCRIFTTAAARPTVDERAGVGVPQANGVGVNGGDDFCAVWPPAEECDATSGGPQRTTLFLSGEVDKTNTFANLQHG